MDEALFEKKLNELVNEIGSLPASDKKRLITLAKRTKNCHDRLKKSINSLQDSVDYLRVSIKYMLFDLEATRRENDYLKKLLQNKEH
jgi:DNA repair protein RadC